MIDDAARLKSFEQAFRDGVGSCRGVCACGIEFYNPDDSWTWEEGELEKLADDPRTKALSWAVGYLTFEGCTYVIDCDCWKARARRVAYFLSAHDEKIAAYLTAEKKRKEAEGRRAPVVT